MARGRAILTAILGTALVACSASGGPSASPVTPSTERPAESATPAAVRPSATATMAGPSSAATVRPASGPTTDPVPQKPAGVTFDEHADVSDDEATVEITQAVTWRAPTNEGVEIRVYGVTECVAEPSNPRPDTHGPCLVEHTPLPDSVRTLLATAPASRGTASWTWTQQTGCDVGMSFDPDGPAYYAVVLAAYGASGHSIFAIAEPGEWWEPGPGEVVC